MRSAVSTDRPGAMRQIESSPIEVLESQPENSRYFMVHLIDPETGIGVTGSIALTPDQQEQFRAISQRIGVDYEDNLPRAAATLVMSELWGEQWPEGAAPDWITEVSREQMLERARSRLQRLEGLAD